MSNVKYEGIKEKLLSGEKIDISKIDFDRDFEIILEAMEELSEDDGREFNVFRDTGFFLP